MKHLIFLVMLVMSISTQAQKNYETSMASALEFMEHGEMTKAESVFDRISKAETEKWLPHYYIAQINSLLSWNEKEETKLKAQLEKAQMHIEKALQLNPNNAELLIMQAQVFTNWVAYDGQIYGMKFSGKINELYSKALQLAPKNPRVVFCKADWDMGSARFFGKDVTPYCNDLKSSLELFANFKPESDISPNWGEERATELTKQCN